MKQIIQFGYKFGFPKNIPLIDCRIIPNSFNQKIIAKNPLVEKLADQAIILLQTYSIIGVGCLYGIHRSGEVIKRIQNKLPYIVIVKR